MQKEELARGSAEALATHTKAMVSIFDYTQAATGNGMPRKMLGMPWFWGLGILEILRPETSRSRSNLRGEPYHSEGPLHLRAGSRGLR